MPNILLKTEAFDNSAWVKGTMAATADTQAAPEFAGVSAGLADTLTDDSTGVAEGAYQTRPKGSNDTSNWVFSVFVRKDSDQTRFPEFTLIFETGGTWKGRAFRINTQTGAVGGHTSPGLPASYGCIDFDSLWWRAWMIESDNASGNTDITAAINPAVADALLTINGGATGDPLGSIVAWGANLTKSNVLLQYEPEPFYQFPDDWSTLTELGSTASSYSDTTAVNGTTYDYRILAANAVGNTPSNIATATAAGNLLPAPGVGLAALVGQASILKRGILMPDQPRPI